jgi:molybdenum cofactor biosynthesis enzyme
LIFRKSIGVRDPFHGPTGVEMEALTAMQVALFTVYGCVFLRD